MIQLRLLINKEGGAMERKLFGELRDVKQS